jgi:hypothetical protein
MGKRAGDGIRTHGEPANIPEKQQISTAGAPKALPAVSPPMVADDDLRTVVEAWPTIPPAMRAGILAMVNAAGSSGVWQMAGIPNRATDCATDG